MQDETGTAPPWWAGVVATLLIGTMVVAFVAPVRLALWPATSWELFSRPRSADQAGYQVQVVASDGAVEPLPFARLGPGHGRWRAIAQTFPSMAIEERTEICHTWAAAAAAALGPDQVSEVRVHRVLRRAPSTGNGPPRIVDRHLMVRCAP